MLLKQFTRISEATQFCQDAIEHTPLPVTGECMQIQDDIVLPQHRHQRNHRHEDKSQLPVVSGERVLSLRIRRVAFCHVWSISGKLDAWQAWHAFNGAAAKQVTAYESPKAAFNHTSAG
jgi:hypothetical protein